ncbi:MAG: hypothetical protein RIT45_746 [Pseudomonadota bacterium]
MTALLGGALGGETAPWEDDMRTWTLASLLAITLGSPSAFALQMCTDAAACASTETCHGGYCLPKTAQCKSDADCAAHQACDMTCPHGGWASGGSGTATSGSTGTGTSTDAPKEGESGSGGGEAPAPGDDGGSGSSGAMPEDATSNSPPCPTDVGICVVKFEKVKPTAACQALCNAAATCDLGDTSSGSSEPPQSTEPLPAPDADGGSSSGGGSSGSSGSGGGSDDAPDGGSSGAPIPSDGGSSGGTDDEADGGGATDPGGEVPVDDGKEDGASDQEACLMMCSVLELEGIAQNEMKALGTCVEANKAGGCEAIEKNCATQSEAAEKAVNAQEDKLEIAMAGFGGMSGSDSGGDSKAGGEANQETGGGGGGGTSNTAGNADDGATSGGGTSGGAGSAGCTASPVAGGNGLALVLLALGALLFRRRLA